MRGKVPAQQAEVLFSGITPAYAGKSRQKGKKLKSGRDHPRLCGEKDQSKALSNDGLGSPPPMRGKVQSITQCSELFGITPAYAGKSNQKEL